ncbi:MAG: ABC transporter permease [Rickettsiales bacterium]
MRINYNSNKNTNYKYLTILYGLLEKEIKRFIIIYHQTILSPIISSFMFVIILLFANNNLEISHIQFILTGSIISAVLQNSFGNSSSSITMSKILGYVTDIIVPPILPSHIIIAYTLASVLRGLIIAFIMMICINFFITLIPFNFIILIIMSLLGGFLMGALGLLSSIVTNSFEASASITNYIVMPLSMLSGTFYSVKKLPLILQKINYFNPFFYIIDGFRYGALGIAEVNIIHTIVILVLFNIFIIYLLYILIKKGYGLQK